jgi:hypothetical protein
MLLALASLFTGAIGVGAFIACIMYGLFTGLLFVYLDYKGE